MKKYCQKLFYFQIKIYLCIAIEGNQFLIFFKPYYYEHDH